MLNNSNLKWITKQDVFSYSKDTLSKMSIKSRKNFSLPKRPKHAFCCVNGTLIVSDKRNNCVYFINTDGEIMEQIDHYPGSIAQNNRNTFLSLILNKEPFQFLITRGNGILK